MASKHSNNLNAVFIDNYLSSDVLKSIQREGFELQDNFDNTRILFKNDDGKTISFTKKFLDDLKYANYIGTVEKTVKDIFSYYNKAPEILKQKTDEILFEKSIKMGLTDPDGLIHIGYDTLYQQTTNPYSTQNVLYHEMAHNLESIGQLKNIPNMPWFKKLSKLEHSSGYANEVFDKNHSYYEDRYSENWAEAIKIVSMAKANEGVAFVSNPNGTMHSEPISYREWKRSNSKMNQLIDGILSSTNENEAINVIKNFYEENNGFN